MNATLDGGCLRRPAGSAAIRRYLGVSFAVSHFIHLARIPALAALDWKLTRVTTIVLAGTAYLFSAVMAATSFDRTAARLGPRKWRLLHLIGGWYIWISFAVGIQRLLRRIVSPTATFS